VRVGRSSRATARIRFGRAARRSLSGRRAVTLTVTAGGVKTTLRVTR
jgi:hypothetical protein